MPTYERANNEDFLPPQEGFVFFAAIMQRKYQINIPIIPIGLKYKDRSLVGSFIKPDAEMKIGRPINLNPEIQNMNQKEVKQIIDKYSQLIFQKIRELSS